MTLKSSIQQLDKYQRPSFSSQGGALRRLFWLLLFRPFVGSWLPGSHWRKVLLILFGAKIGKSCILKPRIEITCPWNLIIGDYCWLGESLWIDNLAPVTIENFVCISQGAYLCTGNHNFKSPGFDLMLGPIYICNEAWIAAKAVIAPNTYIGIGAVIGIGTVVSGNVSERTVIKSSATYSTSSRI